MAITTTNRKGFHVAIMVDNGVSPGDPPAAILLGPSNLRGLTRMLVKTGPDEERHELLLLLTTDELRAMVQALKAELRDAAEAEP